MASPSPEHPLARELLAFIDGSPTPFHAVSEVERRLRAAGFAKLAEGEPWSLVPTQRCYVTRGGASIAAFIIGSEPPHAAGFDLVGAHTDSPTLRLKPQPELRRHGYVQLACEVYGGVLFSTWLDRDLSLAGRVIVDDGTPEGSTRLLRVQRPVLRIPNLAIHLERTVNTEGLKLNAQQHLVPVLGLDKNAGSQDAFLALLARELGCAKGAILGHDLFLYDTQPSSLGGENDELIFAPRLDNLASCFSAVTALCRNKTKAARTRGIVLYDHEEVGSQSARGAGSTFLRDTLERIAVAISPTEPSALARAVARSFLISADMAHAVHPNYADKHERGHRPVLGAGPVLKSNASQSYATDGETLARFTLVCRAAGVTPQHFVSRSDLACGSTIGPISAAETGIRTVDVGNPLLSMHSVREMAASADVSAMQSVLDQFFA